MDIHDDRFYRLNDNDFDNLYVLLKGIDILMTDYSSVYFDFLVMKKPVIIAPFDYEFYIKNARQHYFDYFSNMEGTLVRSWGELYNILEKEIYHAVSDATVKKYCEYNDGNSAKKCFSVVQDINNFTIG